jgi:hypothetical protein
MGGRERFLFIGELGVFAFVIVIVIVIVFQVEFAPIELFGIFDRKSSSHVSLCHARLLREVLWNTVQYPGPVQSASYLIFMLRMLLSICTNFSSVQWEDPGQ